MTSAISLDEPRNFILQLISKLNPNDDIAVVNNLSIVANQIADTRQRKIEQLRESFKGN